MSEIRGEKGKTLNTRDVREKAGMANYVKL